MSSWGPRALLLPAEKVMKLTARSRPLVLVLSDQERIYQATRIVDGVTLCLLDYAQCNSGMDRYDASELAGRLELAVQAIRSLIGGSA
jgi:hypothetical protein